MTEQEIEKLREKLGSDYSVKRLNGAITVELVDIWKGVEFAECVGDNGYSDSWTIGRIYPVEKVSNSNIVLYDNLREYCSVIDFDYRYHPELVCFKPSTEAAYVEQLKAKAKELYGEIKDVDRFDRSDMGFEILQAIDHMSSIERGWDYSKAHDQLYFGDLCLYNNGKWAKKIERIRVVPLEIHYPKPDNLDQYVTVELRVIGGLLDSTKSKWAIEGLAKCLEDYLNKSQ